MTGVFSQREYDSSVADKIEQELIKDTEELDSSLSSFLNIRSKAINARKLALAKYEEEMFAIGDADLDPIAEIKPTVDPNIMRLLNVNKEYEGQDVYADDFIDKLDSEQGTVTSEIRRKKIKDFPVQKADSLPVPNMEEKKNIRERLFSLLEECRINEMRLELEYDLAKSNNEEVKAEELAEQLFIVQKFNSDKLKDIIAEYQPQHVTRVWGNDPDYMEMVNHMAAINSTDKKSSKVRNAPKH